MVETKIAVDGDKRLRDAIRRAILATDDLTVPLELIRESWFKSNLAIFALAGPGKFADLTKKYKASKAFAYGSAYPILFRDGTLKAALTQPGDANSISTIENKRTLVLGVDETKHPYFKFLNDGTKKMKARPYILLGTEQTAQSGLNTRVKRWIEIINQWALQTTKGVGNG